MSSDSDAGMREANLLAGDSILNYRTVASFANEDQIVRDFARMLEGPVEVAKRRSTTIGLVFGFSQFIQYAVFATLFYVGAIFQRNYFEDNYKDPFAIKDYSENIFTAIFVMMFGA